MLGLGVADDKDCVDQEKVPMKSFFREGMFLVIFVNGGEPFVCSKIQKSPRLSALYS